MAGLAELSFLTNAAQDDRSSYLALAAAPPAVSLSLKSRQNALATCITEIGSSRHQLYPSSATEAVLSSCQKLGEETIRENPAQSLAWLLLSSIDAERGNYSGFVANLEQSQRTAPAEQWIARLRVELSERMRRADATLNLDFMDDDLALMVRSSNGVGTIADRYTGQPDFRDRITRIVEALPERDQARFVDWVAEAMRSR